MIHANKIEVDPVDKHSGFLPLKDALKAIGITAPTFYRWIRTGRINDYRIRGDGGRTMLAADAIANLRRAATHVEYSM